MKFSILLSSFVIFLGMMLFGCSSTEKTLETDTLESVDLVYEIGKLRPDSFNWALWNVPTKNWSQYEVLLKDDRYQRPGDGTSRRGVVYTWTDPCFPDSAHELRVHPTQLQLVASEGKNQVIDWAQEITYSQYVNIFRLVRPRLRSSARIGPAYFIHASELVPSFPLKNEPKETDSELSDEEKKICESEGAKRRQLGLAQKILESWNNYFGSRVEKLSLPSLEIFSTLSHKVITNKEFQELQSSGDLKDKKLKIIP